MMFTVYGHPLAAALTGREPEQRPEQYIRDGMQPQSSMREPPEQIDGGRDRSDLGQRQGDQRDDHKVI
jgi:hypothetical protein